MTIIVAVSPRVSWQRFGGTIVADIDLGVCADAGGMLCHPKDVEVIGQIPVQREQAIKFIVSFAL